MKYEFDAEKLQKKSIFLATPMYGGQCAGYYTKSVADLTKICAENGIKLQHYFLFNESLITRARNYCVDEFLRSDYTHLMFIDSDIGFNPVDVIKLLDLCEEGYDIVTGPYPKKTISWEKVKMAVDKGFADKTPFALEQFVGDYVFNPVAGTTSFRIDEPVEIMEGGTGFMMIRREAFEKYAESYPELKYLPDHSRTEHFDGSREITAFFDCVIDPVSKRYLSEDYMFSQYARKIGLKIWMCPWMRMIHVGSYGFGGSLQALAAIQASPTSSKESNRKNFREPDKNLLTKPIKFDNVTGINRKARRAAVKKGK
jgi:hypothetical protein